MKARAVLAAALLLAPAMAWADPITIVATLAPYIGGAAAAAVATAAVFVSTYGGYALAAYSVYGGINARRKAKKAAAAARRAYNESLADRTVTTLQAAPAQRVVYGRAIVGGDIVAILTSDKTGLRDDGGTYTKPDALKHLVIVLAAHQCEDVHEVYIDGIAVGALDGSGWATSGEFGGITRTVYQERVLAAGASATFDGPPTVMSAGYMATGDGGWIDTAYSVSGNTVTNDASSTATISVKFNVSQGVVRWEKHLGTADQLASTYLQGVAPSEWTSDDRLRGLAYVVVTLDLEEARFQGGPPPLTFDVSGRLVYDPRSTSTAHSDNTALIVRDWLTAPWGFGVDAADLDDASIIAAANACDASISLTVGDDTTSGATYTCNGATNTDAAPESVLEELAQSMAGLVTHTGGLWLVNAGTYTAPVLALTEDMQAGAIEVVQAGTAYADLFNGMRGRMIERGRAVESDIDPYSNAAYVTDDGDELWNDITLPWTDNRARARNLVRIFTEQSRESLVIRYPAQLHAWPLQVGDRVTVTSTEYAWAAKAFRVTDWQWSDQSAVLLTLQEDGEAIYDLADAATADSLPNTGLPNPYSVPAITGATAESGTDHLLIQGDGGIVPRVWITWDAVASAYVTQGGRVEIRWRRIAVDSLNEWRTVNVPGNAAGEYLVGAAAGDRITIGLRAVNGLGAAGVEVFISHDVAGDTTPPGPVEEFGVVEVPGGLLYGWKRCTDVDYLRTVLQLHADGDEETTWVADQRPLYVADDTQRWQPWPADGTYAVLARHEDRSGNLSDLTARVLFSIVDQRLTGITRTWLQSSGEPAEWLYGVEDPEAEDILVYEPAWWSGTGATLLIDTPQIEDGAATRVSEVEDETGTAEFNRPGVGFNTVLIQTLHQVSWTNTTGAPVRLVMAGQFAASVTAGAGGAYLVLRYGVAEFTSGAATDDGGVLVPSTPNAAGGPARVVSTFTRELAAGATAWFAAQLFITTAAGTTTSAAASDIDLRIEALLR